MNKSADICMSESMNEALCHVLGNTCRLGRTTNSYEWNVEGHGALAAETCFQRQAKELHRSLGVLASHIRRLGAYAILDYSDSVVVINPPTVEEIPTLRQMIINLQEGHTQAKLSIFAAMDMAQEIDEVTTIQLLASRLNAHRDHLWRLNFLSDDYL